jgi:hypothetical protein
MGEEMGVRADILGHAAEGDYLQAWLRGKYYDHYDINSPVAWEAARFYADQFNDATTLAYMQGKSAPPPGLPHAGPRWMSESGLALLELPLDAALIGLAPRLSGEAELPTGQVGRSSRWPGKQRFDSSGLSPSQIDNAILKSIRRKSGASGTPAGHIAASSDQVEFMLNKVAYEWRNRLAANPDYANYTSWGSGTVLHSRTAAWMRQLNVEGLAVNQRLYGTSQFISPVTQLPYAFRIPDYRLGPTILDLKPAGTPMSGPQFMDFMNFGNSKDIRYIYYSPW